MVGVPKAVGLGRSRRDAAKRDAGAGFLVDEEQEARLRSDGDLSMIAGGFESLAALDERRVKFVRKLDGSAEDGRAEAMKIAASGIGAEEPLRGTEGGGEVG